MDKIAEFLNLAPIDIDLEEYGNTPLKGVPCFMGWQKGEMSQEHRNNLSKAASKRKRTKAHLDKLHEGRRKSKNSLEHTNILIASRTGKAHSDFSKNLMSEKRLSNPKRFDIASTAGKISAAKRASDPHYKKKQSEKMKLIWKKRKEGIVNGD